MAVRFGGTKADRPSAASKPSSASCGIAASSVAECLLQIAPTANTILHDTRTPLVFWFYAMHLLCTTRHSVSGKRASAQTGVTCKAASRIRQQIRKLTKGVNSFEALVSGYVKLDEAYIGAH